MNYALVTGASSGIGRAYAEQLAARGYHPIVVSERAEENRRVAADLATRYGVDALPCCVDLCAEHAAEELYGFVQERGLTVEVLVCNAGALLFGPLVRCDGEAASRLVTLHCSVNLRLCRLFGAGMKARGGGYILIASSATAWMPYPTIAVYAATKAFLRSFAQSLHYELAPSGVAVTALFPGAVDTPFYRLDDRWRRRLLRWGVMMTPQEVARRGLRALFRRRRRCIPGLFTKCCVLACRLLPAWVLRAVLRIPAVGKLLE